MIDWADVMQKAGNIIFVIASPFYLADIIVAQGRLHDALRTYRQSLQLASEHDKPALRMTANAHLGLGLLYHEQGESGSCRTAPAKKQGAGQAD